MDAQKITSNIWCIIVIYLTAVTVSDKVFSPTAAGHWCRSRWCLLQGEQLKSSIILVA